MPTPWYRIADAVERIAQGEMIFDCPVVKWKVEETEMREEERAVEKLIENIEGELSDVIIMTQDCDLENDKVLNITLCPHYDIATYKEVWEQSMRDERNNPTPKAWKSQCEDIKDGFVWNLSMLNLLDDDPVPMNHRIVDFHQVYTCPRNFLDSFIQISVRDRLQLLPPYREHLSQAFARFYMRVGLPVPVTKAW